MWIVCITSVRHVLTVNGYGGRQTKENEKSWCFKGWETLVIYCTYSIWLEIPVLLSRGISFKTVLLKMYRVVAIRCIMLCHSLKLKWQSCAFYTAFL